MLHKTQLMEFTHRNKVISPGAIKPEGAFSMQFTEFITQCSKVCIGVTGDASRSIEPLYFGSTRQEFSHAKAFSRCNIRP